MTYMRAWMSLKFGKIRRLVAIATDRVIMGKKGVATFSRLFFYQTLFILAGNYNMHESSKLDQIWLLLTAELAAL